MIYARKNSKNEDFVIFDPKMTQIVTFRKIGLEIRYIPQKKAKII